MQFSVGGSTNATQEAAVANNYPNIRVFTVGQGTSSKTPLNDLATIEQVWAVATNKSVDNGRAFDFFSSVCWYVCEQPPRARARAHPNADSFSQVFRQGHL